MQIRLTEDIERGLIEKANQLGKPPEMLALEALRKQFARLEKADPDHKEAETLAERLAAHIGVLSSSEYVEGGAQMSKDCGKKFAEGMLRKREEKRL
jgi:hypothetical protein